MLHDTNAKTLQSFLSNDFSRVSTKVAKEICEKAKLYEKSRPSRIAVQEADSLFKTIKLTKIMNPPTDCIAPIGEDLIINGLKKQTNADFYKSNTRSPSVYRGNPFQVEVGMAYGGDLPEEGTIRLLRFANRVPLQYQQSACVITESVTGTAWRNYGLQQSSGALPSGPVIIMIHIASVWVPFTSESKEAIAHYPEIEKEIKLALQECGRHLSTFIRRKKKAAEEIKKKSYIKKYIPHIGIALKEILDLSNKQELKIVNTLTDVLERSRS
jgi:DNA topoisomerase-6 subunit B